MGDRGTAGKSTPDEKKDAITKEMNSKDWQSISKYMTREELETATQVAMGMDHKDGSTYYLQQVIARKRKDKDFNIAGRVRRSRRSTPPAGSCRAGAGWCAA